MLDCLQRLSIVTEVETLRDLHCVPVLLAALARVTFGEAFRRGSHLLLEHQSVWLAIVLVAMLCVN